MKLYNDDQYWYEIYKKIIDEEWLTGNINELEDDKLIIKHSNDIDGNIEYRFFTFEEFKKDKNRIKSIINRWTS